MSKNREIDYTNYDNIIIIYGAMSYYVPLKIMRKI